VSFFAAQNPGIGGLDEITLSEEVALQTVAGLGTPLQVLRTNAGANAVEWATVAGTGDMILADAQSVTGLKTFDTSKLAMKGSSTGVTTIASANAGASNYTTTIPAVTGTIVLGSGTSNELVYWSATNTLGALTVATYPSLTELSYVKGVTSAIQTQLNAKGVGDMVLASVQTNSGAKTFLDATFKLQNVANTFNGSFVNTNTANRIYTLKDAAGTIAFTSDITGTNSGTNTGDQTSIVGITGTMAQFDTAVSDGNIVYQSQALGTPSSGTLTNATGLPATGLVADTTTAVGFGSINLGHASDTTIARSGAGAITVEGVQVVLANTSTTLATITTTGNIELGHASDTTISRVSAGVIAVEGVNVLTTAGGTLTGNITLGENTSIDLDPAGSADGKYSGICITGTAGATLAFGDLIYLAVADSRWELTDADATATAGTPLIGMCVLAAASDGSATKILLQGTIRADAKFPALTVGAPAYVGETAGAIQTAIPTGADNVIRVVGRALTADELYFCPSQDHQITVA
jgi:hypothetical protein